MALKANLTGYLGGGLVALANHFVDSDKVKQLIPKKESGEQNIKNSYLLSIAVILADVFLGNRLRGIAADVLDDSVGAATYHLVKSALENPKSFTGYGVGYFPYQQSYYVPYAQPVSSPPVSAVGAVQPVSGGGLEFEY